MKLSTTILSATLLAGALALAGCGGGSDGGMSDGMNEMTPEEEIAAAKAKQKEAEDKLAAKEEEERIAAEKKAADDARKMAQTLHAAIEASDLVTTTEAGYSKKDGMRGAFKMMGDKFSEEYDSGVTLNGTADDKVMGSAFATATSGRKVHEPNKIISDDETEFVTSGSYHGVPGTYTCTADCASRIDHTSGDLILEGGNWGFEPTSEDVRVSDSNSVEWGWWAVKENDEVKSVRVFYTQPVPDGVKLREAEAQVGGAATYNGSAMGKYSVYRGAGTENDSGHFTADAELKADFKGTPSMTGMIDNFMGADNMLRDWEVELRKMELDDIGGTKDAPTDPMATPGMTVWAMGGVKDGPAGEWKAQLHGQSSTNRGAIPSNVAGAFEAEHGPFGRMIGAFGAEKME